MKILLTYRNTIPIVTFNTSQSLKLHVQGTHACINLDHTGSEGAQVTILSYDIYQTLKLLVTTSNSCCINLGHTGPDGLQVTIISFNIYKTLKLLGTHVVLTLVTLDQMAYK